MNVCLLSGSQCEDTVTRAWSRPGELVVSKVSSVRHILPSYCRHGRSVWLSYFSTAYVIATETTLVTIPVHSCAD